MRDVARHLFIIYFLSNIWDVVLYSAFHINWRGKYFESEPRYIISYKIACAPSEDSDQTARPCALIKLKDNSSNNNNKSFTIKMCLPTCSKCTDSDNTAQAQRIIRAFALHSCILQYPTILLADSGGPDQTARIRRLIWTFAVRIFPKTSFTWHSPNRRNAEN